MAACQQEFPSENLLQDLISSFPREWQGLFASLNVKESLAVHSGTKWLRDNSYSLQKNFISPHWSDLLRSLCLVFPVVLNQRVIFQPKFACFTLKLQRNLLCFIVCHSESISVDDIKVFVSMLAKLPQMKQSWCAALVLTLQTKVNNTDFRIENEDTRKLDSNSKESKNIKEARIAKLPPFCISERNRTRLDNLCSNVKASSLPSSCLLTSKLAEGKSLKVDQSECSPVADMEVDNFIPSEVIEISDSSPEGSPCRSMEIPDPPVFSTLHKIEDIAAHSPVILATRPASEVPNPTDVPNPPDYSTFHETKEMTSTALVSSPTVPLSEVPNPPELENMEIEPSDEDAFMKKYSNLKNHLRSSDELDVELIREFLNCFPENTPKTLVEICKFLEMSTIPETSTVMLITQFLLIEKEYSFRATVVFAEHCISLWLGTLQQAGSRKLLAGVTAFAQKHPKAFVEGVMVKQFNAVTSLLWPQCDLIVKVVKNFEKETLQYFIEKVLQSEERDSSLTWNEHMISLLSVVLDKKIDLAVEIFDKFVDWLQFQSLPLTSSLKFAKLVQTIINKYGSLVKLRLSTFRQILEENNTFLKKSALTALKKLED